MLSAFRKMSGKVVLAASLLSLVSSIPALAGRKSGSEWSQPSRKQRQCVCRNNNVAAQAQAAIQIPIVITVQVLVDVLSGLAAQGLLTPTLAKELNRIINEMSTRPEGNQEDHSEA